jgi:hypothetical protein
MPLWGKGEALEQRHVGGDPGALVGVRVGGDLAEDGDGDEDVVEVGAGHGGNGTTWAVGLESVRDRSDFRPGELLPAQLGDRHDRYELPASGRAWTSQRWRVERPTRERWPVRWPFDPFRRRSFGRLPC